MKFTISKDDFKDLASLTPGEYAATIGKPTHDVKDGAEEGDPGYYRIPFIITETPDGVARTISEIFSCKEGAKFRWAALLKALGMEPEAGSVDIDPEELEGGEVKVTVTHRTYEDRIFNSIKKFSKA